MVMERPPEVNPPSGRVPGQVLQAIPRSESRWRKNRGSFRMMGFSLEVFGTRAKYRPKGDLGGGPLAQEARWHGHPPGRARQAPGRGAAPLRPSFGLLESSELNIF